MSTEIITDPETKEVIESTSEQKQLAKELFQAARDYFEKLYFSLYLINKERLWVHLGYSSWNEACQVEFNFTGDNGSRYVTVAETILKLTSNEKQAPALVQEIIKNDDYSKIEGVDACSLRKTISFFRELGLRKAYEISTVEDINLESIPHGGLPTNWVGKKITVKEIKSSKNLKRDFGPEVVIPPDVISGSKIVKPKNPKQQAREAVSRAVRFLDSLKTELSNFATDDKTYHSVKKDLNQISYQLDHLVKYVKDHTNFIETHDEPVLTDDMFALKEIAGVLDVSSGTLRNMAKKIDPKHFVTVSGASGKEHYINPEGLPHRYKVKWQASRKESMGLSPEEIEMSIWKNAADFQRRKAGAMLNVVKKTMGLSREQVNAFIETFNLTNADSEIAPLSESTLYRWRKNYREKGLAGLLPKHGKNEGLSKVNKKDLKVFKSFYANQNKMALKEARKKTMEAAALEGRIWRDSDTKKYYEIDPETGEQLSLYPTAPTFLRALEREMGSSLAVEYAREGEYKMRQTGKLFTVDRDLTMMRAGDVWVSDHRQIDVQVTADPNQLYNQAKKLLHDTNMNAQDFDTIFKTVKDSLALNIKDKKPVRLWLTAWMDMKSLRWLNCYLHADAPNSDHVIQSFKWAVEEAGGIPKTIYIDNGMDYRCLDFAGKPMKHKVEVDERRIGSLMDNLKIDAVFAIPKNARAKPIERNFRHFIERFEKLWQTYTGKNPADRPEATIENVKRGDIPDALYFKNKFMEFVPMMNATEMNGKEHDGLSPNEVWKKDEPALRKVNKETLSLFTMRSLPEKQIRGNGYYDNQFKRYYFSEEMLEHVGTRVYGLRDPYYPMDAEFFDAESGRHLFTGKLYEGVQGMARTEEEKEKLRQRLELQRKQMGMLNASIRDIAPISVDETLSGIQALLDVNGAVMDMTGTDGNIHIMQDNHLNRIAKSIASSKSNKNRRKNLDLSRLTPTAETKIKPKKKLKTPLDDVGVGDILDDSTTL